jgi:hypothetical protein
MVGIAQGRPPIALVFEVVPQLTPSLRFLFLTWHNEVFGAASLVTTALNLLRAPNRLNPMQWVLAGDLNVQGNNVAAAAGNHQYHYIDSLDQIVCSQNLRDINLSQDFRRWAMLCSDSRHYALFAEFTLVG